MTYSALGLVGFGGELGGKTVTGAPFRANISTQTTQTLADGNSIQHTTTGIIARDSEGRTRRDITLPAIGPFAASGQAPPHAVDINDPVAGAQYILEPDRKVAHKIMRRERGARLRFETGTTLRGGQEDQREVTTASLGAQIIGGVAADGTRYTRTIPAGEIGNAKPIMMVTESWYSPDLQIVVMTKRSDPINGDSVFQLTDIQRQEPDPSLFQVPSDYTVKKGGEGRIVIRRFRGMPAPPGDGPLPPEN
ncbi:MAG TPA: hypothetical protein VJO53_07525 [Candidatus Acidoferrales bacterium]|nr:hypothetical protein [Candidatus Acidoferrales bacterium]